MEALNGSRLRALARLEAEPCVSIFLPVPSPGGAPREAAIRLQNLAREAEGLLLAGGADGARVGELLGPVADLVVEAERTALPVGGLAVYIAPGFFRALSVDFPLPEAVRVGGRFALRPLLPALVAPERFYVLALSANRVRLYEGGSHLWRELAPAGLPKSFEEAMGYVEYYSGVSAHTSTARGLGRRPPIFHGHGDDDEERADIDLENFFRRVVEALERGLPDPGAPLVLATIAAHVPLFRRANRRLKLLERSVVGNADHVTEGELAGAAREILAAESRRAVVRELVRWREERGEGGRGVVDLEEIVRAADEGRIETLFLAREAERWGSYEPDLRRVTVHETREPGDEELLERAAGRTLAQRGDVRALPIAAMPEGRIAVATLRFTAPLSP